MGIEDFWGSSLAEVLMRSPGLSREARQRVGKWMWLTRDPDYRPLHRTRFVVVDTETSGLDVRSDTLLSIGACIVHEGKVCLAESFYRELRQESASGTANILLHGIGREAQLAGEPEADALSSFLEFAGKQPVVAFNAPFDEAFLSAAMRRYLGVRYRPRWIDLAQLPKAMYPADAQERLTLDDWLARFAIVHLERHHALGDAFSTAQLLLVMLKKAELEGYSNVRGLLRAQKNYHWQRRSRD